MVYHRADSAFRVLRGLTIAALVVVAALLARTADAQSYGRYPSLPFPLEKAIDSADVDLIMNARVSATRNDLYTMRSQGQRTVQLPETVVTVVVVEVFKNHNVVTPGRSLEIRHVGFTADDGSSEAVRRRTDAQWPSLDVGREYLLFLSTNEKGEFGFFSPQGVFGLHEGKVMTLIPSRVGDTWKGKPWETFLQTIRRHSQKQPR